MMNFYEKGKYSIEKRRDKNPRCLVARTKPRIISQRNKYPSKPQNEANFESFRIFKGEPDPLPFDRF